MPSRKLYEDVKTFARAMLESRDLDPLYDVLRELYVAMDLDEERALWFTTLYLAYYNLPSALTAFWYLPLDDAYELLHGAGEPQALTALPMATERRNLRIGGKVVLNLQSYLGWVAVFGSQRLFLRQRWGDNPERNFLAFWDTAQSVWGNGRWAAFKWADLLKNVHGWNLAAPDMRMAFCSGPKEGLQLLYGYPTEDVPTLDRMGADLRERLAADGLNLDWEELETVLCNFKSLYKGKYYVGHDIDELQERIDLSGRFLGLDERARLYRARQASLPAAYLGERHGWHGIDRARMGAYKATGAILTREEVDVAAH